MNVFWAFTQRCCEKISVILEETLPGTIYNNDHYCSTTSFRHECSNFIPIVRIKESSRVFRMRRGPYLSEHFKKRLEKSFDK